MIPQTPVFDSNARSEGVMISLPWQTSLQNRQWHALCMLGKIIKCWLGFWLIFLWSLHGTLIQCGVGTVRACEGLPWIHGDLVALHICSKPCQGWLRLGCPFVVYMVIWVCTCWHEQWSLVIVFHVCLMRPWLPIEHHVTTAS